MKNKFTAVIKQDEGWWIGWVAEIPRELPRQDPRRTCEKPPFGLERSIGIITQALQIQSAARAKTLDGFEHHSYLEPPSE